jgi:hypothetical protein
MHEVLDTLLACFVWLSSPTTGSTVNARPPHVEGRRVLADMKRRAEQHVAERLAPLSPTQRVDLVATLQMLTTTLITPDAVACVAIKEQA